MCSCAKKASKIAALQQKVQCRASRKKCAAVAKVCSSKSSAAPAPVIWILCSPAAAVLHFRGREILKLLKRVRSRAGVICEVSFFLDSQRFIHRSRLRQVLHRFARLFPGRLLSILAELRPQIGGSLRGGGLEFAGGDFRGESGKASCPCWAIWLCIWPDSSWESTSCGRGESTDRPV